MEKSIKKNDELVVQIDRFGSNGEGIAEVDGKVVFVPFALPGEKVLVHIINDKNSFLVAKIVEILSPSKSRIEPPCKYYKKCGGCDTQHMCYQKELEYKRELVKNNLKKYAGIDIEIPEVIFGKKEFRYRNKFAFPVQEEGGEIKIGMYQKNSHKVIEIDDCLLQSVRAKIIIKIFKEFMQKNQLSGYNEESKTGLVKHIVVRESETSFILTVVLSENKDVDFKPLIDKLSERFESFGIYKNVNNLKNNVIFGNLDIHIYGLKELEKHEFGISYFINNRSFLQVNDEVKNFIYQKILELVSGEKNIIDAYSGAGLLSSIIAKKGTNVVGVEIIKEATENADKLKIINNLYNLTNKNGDCAKILPELAKEYSGDFSVIVDPPRKGVAKEVVDAFLLSKPNKIIYLSCESSTLARDLKFLVQDYDIKFIEAFDLFPKTANVETLVCLERKTQNTQKIDKNKRKITKNNKKLSKNSRYFDFYDDIKSGCQKRVDW